MPTLPAIHEARTARRTGTSPATSRPPRHDAPQHEPGRGSAAPLARGVRRVPCLPEDAVAIDRLLARAALQQETPDSAAHRYLDHLIRKPWGRELRIYVDALVDIWMLMLAAGASTSLHCHPRKHTCLLCLDGLGEVTTGNGGRMTIARGTVLQIEEGAMHRTRALEPLTLVEVEAPRNKLDLLRDGEDRREQPYEGAAHVLRLLLPLRETHDAPRTGRVREPLAIDRYGVAIERGAELASRPDDLLFAISLETPAIVRRKVTVAGPLTKVAPNADDVHLTLRTR